MLWKLGFGRQPPPHETADPRSGVRQAEAAAIEGPARPAPPSQLDPLSQLDSEGQRGELLRVRVSQLAERLEEVRSLPADFAAILGPLSEITAELPKVRVRNAELEGLLSRERDSVGDLRRHVAELTTRGNAASTELLHARGELQRTEIALREREAEAGELRGNLAERAQVADDLARQFGAEAERARGLAAENKALRAEVQTLDQAATRVGRDLAETRERLALAEQEGRRLQLLGEEQAARISDLTARGQVFAEEGAASRERLHAAEARLGAETAARERAEAQAQVELATARAEIGNLALRLEAATSRAGALDRLLAQVRLQLRDREESVRVAERLAKDAESERLSHERRVEALQSELTRSGERWAEAQQSRADLDARCDMLGKALAAKDVALEQAMGRAAALSDQADQLGRRNETERAELEAAVRRLTEELHNERSERALARGALDIARESRASLQRQYDALRKSGRFPGPAEPAAEDAVPPTSNVRSFLPPDRG